MKWVLTNFLAKMLVVFGFIFVCFVISAGQPRTVVYGDELFFTNTVVRSWDNHRGCFECQSILHDKRKVPYPLGHPGSHLREPYIPASEMWIVTNKEVTVVVRINWRGQELWGTNVLKVLSSDTNFFRTQFVRVPLPPPLLP